jgi:hypothetical protein
MSQYIITPNLQASGTIYPNRFVKMDPSNGFSALQAGNNDPSIGVAFPGTNLFPDGSLSAAIPAAVAGQAVTIAGPMSQVQVQLGGSVPVASFLKSDANGKAVVASPGDNLAAYTWATGVTDDLIQCVLLPPLNESGGVVMAVIPLVPATIHGATQAWVQPEATPIIITSSLLNIVTKSTSACSLDIGTTASSATTNSNNLFDSQDVGTSAGVFAGSTTPQKLASGKWVTIQEESGDVTGLVGTLFLFYVVVPA